MNPNITIKPMIPFKPSFVFSLPNKRQQTIIINKTAIIKAKPPSKIFLQNTYNISNYTQYIGNSQ